MPTRRGRYPGYHPDPAGSGLIMGKMDQLRRTSAGNVAESMGAGLESPSRLRPASGAGPRALPAALQGVSRSKDVAQIRLDRIVPDPDQPREDFDDESLDRLADSLKNRGQLQPIRVRWDEPRDRYVIVCGERRWRAAEIARASEHRLRDRRGPLSATDLWRSSLSRTPCART